MEDKALALVEEPAHDEKPTEHITRLIDSKLLLEELHQNRKRVKQLESDLENTRSELDYARKHQGGRKMGSSVFGKAVTACAITAAAVLGLYSVSANSNLEAMRRTSYTAFELSQIIPLRKELEEQVKAADAYLGTIKKVERNYEVLARDSLKYIDSSVPRGELEDAVAEEVAGLRQFFNSTRYGRVAGRVEFCQSRYRDAERDDLPKSSLHTAVWYANDGYSKTMRHYNERSEGIVTMLSRFRRYVEHHPLKQRMQMLARIDIEIGARNTVIEQTAKYRGMFDANNASDNIIPVNPLEDKAK